MIQFNSNPKDVVVERVSVVPVKGESCMGVGDLVRVGISGGRIAFGHLRHC